MGKEKRERTRHTFSAMDDAAPKELRAVQVAHVLARGVRNGEIDAIDAGRILKRELRRLNTNRSHTLSRCPGKH
jgi:hypothetical protein